MIRSRFEHQLHDLNTNLIVMGTLCEDIISKSLVHWKRMIFTWSTMSAKPFKRLNSWSETLKSSV